MGRPMKVDDVRVAAMTRAGWSVAAIAAEFDCSERIVHQARRRAGVAQPRVSPLSPTERATIERLLDDGCSLTEAARTVGRSVSTIHRHYGDRGWTHQECGRFAMAVRYAGKPARTVS